MSLGEFQLNSKAKVHKCPCYSHVLSILAQFPDSIYLDVGCFTGVDVRRMVHDGWPPDQVLAIDSNPLWFDLGWKLFQDRENSKIRFISCDLLKMHSDSSLPASSPGTDSVEAANKIRAISAFAFFHLYSEEHQVQLALRLWDLLDKQRGNIIFGIQKGMQEATHRNLPEEKEGQDVYFCHSPASWKALWDHHLNGKADVEAHLAPSGHPPQAGQMYDMIWTVIVS